MATLSAWSSKTALLTTPMPFEYCGSICELGDGHFVACGSDTLPNATSYLVRLEIGANWKPIHIHETVAYPGFDFVDIAYDAQAGLVVCLDDKTRSLVSAPLPAPSKPSAQPILPAAFSRVVTPTQLPTLMSPLARLGSKHGSFLVRVSRLGTPQVVTPQSPTWSIAADSDVEGNRWRVKAEATHATSLQVKSDAKQLGDDNAFTIRTADGQTIGSGTQANVGTWQTVPPPTYFYDYPGYPCHVAGALSYSSASFVPLVRYGKSNDGLNIRLGNATMAESSVSVATPSAICLLRTTLPSLPAGETGPSAQDLRGFLLLALGSRKPDAGPDPVTGTGPRARLQFTEALAVTARQVRRTAYMGTSVALPDAPALSAFVLLSQWALVDPDDPTSLVYSDICAVRIRPRNRSTEASASEQKTLSAAQKATVQSRFRAALMADPRCQTAASLGNDRDLLAHRRK